jgi:hypothetical protein
LRPSRRSLRSAPLTRDEHSTLPNRCDDIVKALLITEARVRSKAVRSLSTQSRGLLHKPSQRRVFHARVPYIGLSLFLILPRACVVCAHMMQFLGVQLALLRLDDAGTYVRFSTLHEGRAQRLSRIRSIRPSGRSEDWHLSKRLEQNARTLRLPPPVFRERLRFLYICSSIHCPVCGQTQPALRHD